MKFVLCPIILALFFRSGSGNLTRLLDRVPEKASAQEEMLERFVLKLVDDYKDADISLLIQDEDFDASGFYSFFSGLVMNFGLRFTINLVTSHEGINEVLKNSFWTERTIFILVLRTTQQDDSFFVEMQHQSIDFKTVKALHIKKDFSQNVLRNETWYARVMKGAFKRFWSSRVTNVIALAPKKSNVYVYTYFPYTRVNCPDSLAPVLTNVWFPASERFYHRHGLFPDKLRNLHKCPLNVTLISSPPGIMAERGTIDGIEGELLKYIFDRINATPKYHFVNPQDVSLNDSETALNFLLESIRTGDGDLGAGFLIPTTAYTGYTDEVHIGLGLCLTWAVPKINIYGGTLNAITDTFTLGLWNTFFGVASISALVLWRLLRRKKLVSSVFCIIAISLGKPVALPRDKITKTFLVTLIWYSIVLGSAFQAGLGSNNIISSPPPQFESTREIIENGFEILGVESAVQLFKEDIKFLRENGQAVRVEAMDIQNALLKVAFKRKTAYVGFRLAIVYYVQFLNPELTDHVYVHSKCLLNYQPFFALRKSSPLTLRVRKLTSSLIESGVKGKLEQKYLERILRPGKRRRVMSKGDALAWGSLMILWIGLGVSILVFAGECFFYVLKRATCPPKNRG